MKHSDLCAWCGNAFSCQREHAKFCSSTCRVRAYRAKKAITKIGTEGFTAVQIDTLNLIRSQSERAYLAILHTRKTYGLNAARCALWACWCLSQCDVVDPSEAPYESPDTAIMRGIPFTFHDIAALTVAN